ncbi:MAG TPA: GNAT family N-acetyltransferase [Chloroflexi bacterium]|nr:GNAT family N-acetyltransferase [Chloroflexota bacterium]
MAKLGAEDVEIRVMRESDLGPVTDIDYKVFGQRRPDYYERKIAEVLDEESGRLVTSLVAEVEGKVAGFIMGSVYLGEFGIPESIAYIDTIGVDPAYQRQGVAGYLLDEFKSTVGKAGVRKVHTLVNWADTDLLSFFADEGFVAANTLNLKFDLG